MIELEEGTSLYEIAIAYKEKTYQQLPYIQAPSEEAARIAVVKWLEEQEVEYTDLEFLVVKEIDITKKIIFN